MRYALTSAQMRTAEERAVADGIVTVAELMSRAGRAVCAEVGRRVPEGVAAVLCGPGNNGGDGWVTAAALALDGRAVTVVSGIAPGAATGDAARDAAVRAVEAGVRWVGIDDTDAVGRVLEDADVIVDALFGLGFNGSPRGSYAHLIEQLGGHGATIVSVDVPSGVDSDTGAVAGPAVDADVTVSFTAHKPGLLIHPGASHAGEVVLVDIGVPLGLPCQDGYLELPEVADLRPWLPLPAVTDHKGSRGRVAIVAGSAAYPGAAVLAARGALSLGPGYVTLVVPQNVAALAHAALPNVIVRGVPEDGDGALADAEAVLAAAADADAVVVGPGVTTAAGPVRVVGALIERVSVPLLIDADGLNVLASDTSGLHARVRPTVLTPHPGEMARIAGTAIAVIEADRIGAASALSGACRACVLKGPRTVIAGEGRIALALAGTPALARAGTGDVLAGMIGTLLAQGLTPFEAAVLGAHLHGWAGEHGAAERTAVCLDATDVPSFVPDAVRRLLGG